MQPARMTQTSRGSILMNPPGNKTIRFEVGAGSRPGHERNAVSPTLGFPACT